MVGNKEEPVWPSEIKRQLALAVSVELMESPRSIPQILKDYGCVQCIQSTTDQLCPSSAMSSQEKLRVIAFLRGFFSPELNAHAAASKPILLIFWVNTIADHGTLGTIEPWTTLTRWQVASSARKPA